MATGQGVREGGGVTATSKSLPRRIYGVRLFYSPESRRRIALGTAAVATVGYIAQAAAQIALLRTSALKWDFLQFYTAALDLAAGHNPYTGFLDACPGTHWCQGGYIFPTLLAVVFEPLTRLQILDAARIWLVLTHLLLLATIVVVWRALCDLISPTVAALLLVAALLFQPLYQSLFFLQVGVLLTLLIAVAGAGILRGDRRGEIVAGISLGFAAVLRVTPLLLAPLLVGAEADPAGRRRIRWWGLFCMIATGIGLLAVLELATPYTTTFFIDVLPRIGGGTSSLDNASLLAVIDRGFELWGGTDPSAAVVGVAGVLVFLFPAWLMWQLAPAGGWLEPRRLRAVGFAAVLSAVPIVSSITWQHHLITELLVYAFLAPALMVRPGGTAGRLVSVATWLAVASYPLMWTDRHITDGIAVAVGVADPSGVRVAPFLVITGVNVIGMTCLWLSCVIVLVAARQPALAGSVTDDNLRSVRPGRLTRAGSEVVKRG